MIRNLTIYNMDDGIYWGNSTFNVEWDNVLPQNNLNYGWYYPSTSTGGGQVNNFYHSSLSGNRKGAWYISQTPQVTFSGFGMDIEYNGNQNMPNSTAAMTGGTYSCFDCHIESNFGPFVEMPANNQRDATVADSVDGRRSSGDTEVMFRLLPDEIDLTDSHLETNDCTARMRFGALVQFLYHWHSFDISCHTL